ncbi:hypothetical protein COB57_00025 [Candidatus Peregrinibacteria bacterium]|nr:MAG: hypothetical protein COB57_00025 [Candidatus Peregrinibacteria bacterium]
MKNFSKQRHIGIDARLYSINATGIGRHVSELIDQLSHLDTNNIYTIFLRKEAFDIFILPGENFRKELADYNHYSFQEQWTFFWQLRKQKFDLMVFPHFNVPLLYFRPYVVTIHDLTLHFFQGKKKTDFLSRMAYYLVIHSAVKKAKHCFAVSENTKKDMIQHLGLKSEKITRAYNGVSQKFSCIQTAEDQQDFNNAKKEFQFPEKYFLYTGVRRSHKNITGLVKAYALFREKYPSSDIMLVFSGPIDTIYQEELQMLLEKYSLGEYVKDYGLFPEKSFKHLFLGAHAFVFPSFYEGFGIPPIEAMQCGLVVASSSTSSLPEACGDAVEYFDPYDINDMCRAMEVVAFDEDRRNELREKGFHQIHKFTWEDMAKTMLEVYKKVLYEK